MEVVSWICCIQVFATDPAANPYRVAFLIALLLLLSAFLVWRHVRPPPRPLLRWYMGAGASCTVLTTCAQTCNDYTPSGTADACRVVVHATFVVAASLVAEVLLSRRRSRLARAVAYIRIDAKRRSNHAML